jgi:hypothetical protein
MEPRTDTNARIAAQPAIVMLLGAAALALQVIARKTGPDAFFPEVTLWQGPHPMLEPLAIIGVIMLLFGSLVLMAIGSAVAGRARAACTAAFPAAIALIAVLPNGPHWFAVATLASAAGLATYIGVR